MGCSYKLLFSRKLNYLAICFLFLLIPSSTQVRFMAEARASPALRTGTASQTVNEDKKILRSQIGSRPPRCDRRCRSCGHCEAIQVPTNPQVNNGNRNNSTVSTITYVRGDGNSNYKPISWKCKCGNLIFNP